MQNRAIAAMFNDIADMLENKGESTFRITAYRRAARALEGLTEDVAAIAARGELEEIPGIGKGTAEKIQEFLRTGTSKYYEELRASLPPGITALMSVPEVGPRTAMLLYERLGIKTIDELEQACKAGKVRKLPRMGERTEEDILKVIALLRRTKERLPIGQVLPPAQELVAALRGEKAVKKGLKINEYGVFHVQDDRRIAGRTEEEVYAAVGLPWIPPEIREDQGEIELAERAGLPKLIELGDMHGDLQMHTRWSDGSDSVEAMAKAAKALGYEYLAITDHSQSLKFVGGVTVDELREHARAAKKASDKVGIAVLMGTECDILPDGRLDYPDDTLRDLDVVVCSVHSRLRMPRQEMTARIVKAMENRHTDILGHPTGRLLGQREAYEIDLEQLIDAALRTGTALEINASPQRLDLNDVQAKTAKERGAQLVISTDAHNRYQLKYMEFGIGIARRAWIEATNVLNTLPLVQLQAWLHER